MPTNNVVEAILCRDKLQWGAFWKLFEWLLDPNEGHGLGAQIASSLHSYVFNQAFPVCLIKREYKFKAVNGEKEKWPDLILVAPSFEGAKHIMLMDDVDLR